MKGPMGDTQLALALALEGVSTPTSEEVERLVGVAGLLNDLPDPDIDPRFIARLEARLMAEPVDVPAQTLHIVKDEAPVAAPERTPLPLNVVPLPRRRFVVRKALVAAIAAAMLFALPIVASAQSLPGDPLFGIEQFRQNTAISHAHGSHKAFVIENVARKWYGYGIQMTALGYSQSRVAQAFARAGELQARATSVVLSLGTPLQIQELRDMIQADVNWLVESATTLTGGPSHPVLLDAITAAAGHASMLGRALGLQVHTPTLAEVTQQVQGSTGSGTGSSSSGGSSSSTTEGTGQSSGTGAPGEPKTPPVAQNPAPRACHVIGEYELGDTLAGVSKAVCNVQKDAKTR